MDSPTKRQDQEKHHNQEKARRRFILGLTAFGAYSLGAFAYVLGNLAFVIGLGFFVAYTAQSLLKSWEK